MIPVKLHLHNFLSYGDQSEPIAFDGIHVACLCGPNGHGKSALLDGITWALWGQARSNAADDLVRLGQKDMWVEFEFLLEGRQYRVVRKRTIGKNSQSDLHFQVRKEDGSWNALTGQGVRGTQERIVQALRMDYETFINSAFILQGRADEFARKTAGDRKRILGEILSLGVYDELCEKARLRRREAEMRVNALEAEITRMEQEHARLPQWSAHVERFEAEQVRARLALETARAARGEILVEKLRLDSRRKERDDLARRLDLGEGDIASVREQLAAVQRRLEGHTSLVQRAKQIRDAFEELKALRKEQEELTVRSLALRTLEAERNHFLRDLQAAESELNTRLQLARQEAGQLRALADLLPQYGSQLADLETQAAALDRMEEERAGLQARLPDLAAERAKAQADQAQLRQEMDRAEERFQMLKEAQATCPVCEGELPPPKRLEMGRKVRFEKEELKLARGQAIEREAQANRAEAEAKRRLADLAAKLKTGRHMRDQLVRVREEQRRCEEAARRLPGAVQQAEEMEALLRSGDCKPELRGALKAVEERIQALAFDEKLHGRTAARIAQLGSAERDFHALEQAEAALPSDRRHAEALDLALKAKEEALAADRAARAEADRDLAKAPDVEAEAARREAALGEAEGAERTITQQLGGARELRQRCEELAPQITERKRERDAAARDHAAYDELSKAFGRNGIQALIIENALPEIENEANALLQRMSDGQLNIALKTQKDLRTGGQAETLDIEISDGVGARKYELYSGGEAFRVNFALRIALSKLLARRAGARLETLVVDEGFGSQDLEGRQRLVEAIQAVQDDFARILVITHLEDLKDAFPTRVEISKGPAGSQAAVY